MKVNPFYFWIPDPKAFHSGGNLYNDNLINALQVKGIVGQQITKGDIKSIKKGSYLFVDTLYLDQLDELPTDSSLVLIVHHLESLFPPSGWQSEAYFQRFEKEKLEKFDAFLCSSAFTKSYLQANGLSDKHYLVVPPAIGFETSAFHPESSIVQPLLVANWVKRKGLLPFLQALSEIEKGSWLDRLRITLIGGFEIEPDYAKACLNLINRSSILQKILDVKGELSHEATLFAYPRANLFISTSFMETYGMAMQEAKAFGLPILALKGGNVQNHSLIGNGGLLFESIDNLIAQLLQFCNTPEQLLKLQMEARRSETIRKRDWTVAAEELVSQLPEKKC